MTSESSEPDELDVVAAWHREMERLIEFWDDEPTHEKWRRGREWN